jgi:hypothetical protein
MASLSSMLGRVLGTVFRVAGEVRPAAKPLHPKGDLRRGTLRRYGVERPIGVPFLDTEATDEVLVRLSRAAGLPRPLPDVHGLALRVPNPDGTHGDLLFATTGLGWLTRFILIPTRSETGRPMTTLLPYDTAVGPVLLGVRPTGEDRFEVCFAVGEGPWRTFGELELSGQADDEEISFDAVRNTLPGLAQYAAVRRLREPAYEAARSSRGEV